MSEKKKRVLLHEKKSNEIPSAQNKNILFKECKNTNEFKEAFVNIETDYSLESEKEKSNISLFNVFKKKLKEEKQYSRFLMLFQIPKDANKKKCTNETLKNVLQEKYKNIITGICLFVNIYAIMLLESHDTKDIFRFIKHLNEIPNVSAVKILYFSELNKQNVTDQFFFFDYNKEQPKVSIPPGEYNYVDEVWELYINIMHFCCLLKNNEERQESFYKNENIKKNFSHLPNLYNDNAKQYIWSIDEFISFFMDDFYLSLDDFSDDFMDL
ncbi:hypothetical protein, conserved [Plasmodium gonderi]|uniref:Uncharacterized protein n=1 Tax=Plasmodium gonderi TaxID=77519 RepID=A0A1Y1JJ91_PLAGO|nr:hypothetical protein, conserved [Plasmodium gonderi]GAW82300.1 hypothetical protein, conserved [Plasmodium gonderi]